MNRVFRFVEPVPVGRVVEVAEGGQGVTLEMTEQEILDLHWEHWKDVMTRAGKGPGITPEACIEDFITVHWAWEVKEQT